MNTRQIPQIKEINGFRVPTGFVDEKFLSALQYQAQDSDTFICTYPKCGTTWMQHIIWLITHEGHPITEDKKISVEIPFLEFLGAEFVKNRPTPRFIKTHLTLELIPKNNASKYIYVARNPFDCLVSFYYHTKGFPQYYHFEDGSFDDYFEFFLDGATDFGDYFDHLIPWMGQRNAPNVFFVTYEDMKANFRTKLLELLQFLGPDYAPIAQNEALLAQIELHSSFDEMSKNQLRWTTALRPEGMPFVRKGVVGDGKNMLSPTQYQRLFDKMKARGADVLW